MTFKPEELTEQILIEMRRRNQPHIREQPNRLDFESILSFAEKVIVDIGLDISRAPTYFEANESEIGCPDIKSITDSCSLQVGQDIDIYVGYYTAPETYRLIEDDEGYEQIVRVRDINGNP